MKKAERSSAGEEDEDMASIRRAVKELHFGGWEEKAAAAAAIRDLTKKKNKDFSNKRALAELGVVQTLVSMLVNGEADDGDAPHSQLPVVEALVELSNDSITNKIVIVECGLLTKLPQIQSKAEPYIKQSLAPLLLSISSLSQTQFPINSQPILSFLLNILRSTSSPSPATILASAAALCNLSLQLENAKSIVSAGAVPLLLGLCFHADATPAALSALVNLAITEDGKKAVEEDPLVPGALVSVMVRDEEPRCFELAAYILMLVARRSAAQRSRMLEAGVVQMLIQVGLMGSSHSARERALWMLSWFKKERKNGDVKKRRCRGEIKCLVRQSLDKNMQSLLKRCGGGIIASVTLT